MVNFNKIVYVFILAIALPLFSCKGKSEKQSIVGKWTYKELVYTAPNKNLELSRKEQEKIKERDDEQATGTIFTFNKDNSFSASTPQGGRPQVIQGTYELNESGEITMTKKGESKPEKAKILLLDKTTLKLLDEEEGIIVVFNRAN
jgi:Lipocalin-like domain